MRSLKVGLGVAFGMQVVAAVGAVVTGELRMALSPGVGAVLTGVLLYRVIRNPPAPRLWTKRRVVGSAVLMGAASLMVIGCMVWMVVNNPQWELGIAAVVCILFVLGALAWMLRFARAEHQEALRIAQEATSEGA